MLSYVVLTSKSLPADVDSRFTRAAHRGLYYEPAASTTVRNARGTVVAAAWERRVGPLPNGPHWHHDTDVFVALSGYAVPDGGWSGHDGWLARLSAVVPARGVGVLDDLWGTFTLLWLDRDGRGFAAVDPLSTAALYRAERNGVVAVSNCSALAAYAVVDADEEPARHAAGPAWYVAYDTAIGLTTGFRDVAAVPAFEAVSIDPDGTILSVPVARPFDEPLDDHGDPVAAVWNELCTHIEALPTLPVTRVGLTGGRDSRLLVAAAAALGIERDLRYFTLATAPDSADPAVASQVAATLGLDHEIITAAGAQRDTTWFEDQVRSHVFKCSGMFPAVAFRGDLHPPPVTNVSGTFGELMRDFYAMRELPATTDDAVAGLLAGRQPPAHEGVCRPEVLTEHRAALRAQRARRWATTASRRPMSPIASTSSSACTVGSVPRSS